MPTFSPTTEQRFILEAGRDTNASLLIEARAGTGKTATLIQLLPLLRGSTCLMAFNRAIADELKLRTADLPFETKLALEIGTVHALGLKALKKGLGGTPPRTNGGKVNFLLKDLLKTLPQREQQMFQPVTYLISKMVGGAKSNGFGLYSANETFPDIDDVGAWEALLAHMNWDVALEDADVPADKAIDLAIKLLIRSNQTLNLIDFDDMIYLPLLLNHPIPQYANVLIDEAQDISATRRELAFRMMKPPKPHTDMSFSSPGGRMIAVGDEFQAIYGFTGADASSLPNIARRCDPIRLPLTICWRCDDAIITEAQKMVPDIMARPNAAAGSVRRLNYASIVEALSGNLPPEKFDPADLPSNGDAILCRLNRPNVSMALQLLRAGKRARIEGKDIGSRLLHHVKTADPMYNFNSCEDLLDNVQRWGAQEVARLAAKGRESSAAMLDDEVGCAVVLLERCIEQAAQGYDDLEWLVQDLFDDNIPPSGVITLSSVHKSKGREWPRVYILGRFDYMPFHMAKQPWEKQQERNLIYVAGTRAERELILVTEVQSTLDKQKKARQPVELD